MNYISLSLKHFRLYPLHFRVNVESTAFNTLYSKNYNVSEAIKELEELEDELAGHYFVSIDTRVTEDGKCSYCDDPIPEDIKDLEMSQLEPCGFLSEDLEETVQAKHRLLVGLVMPERVAAGVSARQLATAYTFAQATGDWTSAYQIMLGLPVSDTKTKMSQWDPTSTSLEDFLREIVDEEGDDNE